MPIKEIIDIRILPALAISRLGSSPHPMDNFEWKFQTESAIGKLFLQKPFI